MVNFYIDGQANEIRERVSSLRINAVVVLESDFP